MKTLNRHRPMKKKYVRANEGLQLGLDTNISTKYVHVTKNTRVTRTKKPRKLCFWEYNEN